jgi:integrase
MKTGNKIPFTKRCLEALPTPETSRVYYHDARTEGLTLCVTLAGTKTFYLYRWHQGRPVRIPLGRFPATSIEQARRQAKALMGDMAKGTDPQAARQAARHEQTVSGLFTFWLETHAKPRKRSWQADVVRYNAYLRPWANRKLSSIHKADVQALHAKVGAERGPYAANRLLTLIKAMFYRADDMGHVGVNPAVSVRRFPEEKRDRFLHGDELPAFFQALNAEPNDTLRDFFLVALLTGARKTNILTMQWADVSFDLGLWRIPETKSGEPVVVPLSTPALAILRRRFEARHGSSWVFPSKGKTGHLVEPKSAWKRICDRARLQHVRIHDLRRSLGSWQAMMGSSLPIIGKSLGHKQASTTMIYARLEVAPVRESVETAANAMLEAGGMTKLLGDANESREAKD